MKKFRLQDLHTQSTHLLPDLFGSAAITGGGLYLFKPGETAHPEAVHVHAVPEVFIFIQGRGVLPINGVDYPVQAGDVVIVDAGEDHHTRSSFDEPLVAAWYLMEA